MRRRLLLSYLSLAAVVLVVLEVPLGILESRREHDQLASQAESKAGALAVAAQEYFEHPDRPDLADVIGRYQGGPGTEVTIVGIDGNVVIQQDPDAAHEPAVDARAVTAKALAGHPATEERRDEGEPVLSASVPVRTAGGVVGAVVVSVPASAAEHRIGVLVAGLVAVAITTLGLTTILGLVLARSVTEPLADLEDAASRLGEGELSVRAAEGGPVEVRTLAQQFNQMAGRLEELVSAQRRFVADASHQLRSPLTALRLRLENLQDEVGAEAAADLEAASNEVLRLSRIVDGLLTLSRAEGTRPERQRVDAAQVVEDRREAWSALADERAVQLRVDVDAAAGSRRAVRVVPGHLEQILDNLLANALDATPAGGGITLRLDGDRARVRVHVVDEGPGMTVEERGRAFDRFWQGSARRNGSSGLGLAIVQQLARANGGEIVLDEAPGGGLDASVELEPA